MANSYRKIDYRFRPAKGVERRLMLDYIQRFRQFSPLESYRYIGMGSVYFSDFSLFHTSCGFESMISLEGASDPTIQKRFNFNKPFGNIDVIFKMSHEALPLIDWTPRSIVWLDYDGPLNSLVLGDVRFIASKMVTGSALFISVNSDLKDDEANQKGRMDVLRERVGADLIPASHQGATNIAAKDIPKVFWEIVDGQIRLALNNRNAGLASGEKMELHQIMFMTYKDDADMLTIGWVFAENSEFSSYEKCGFELLPHYRGGSMPFEIKIPLLTAAEVRELNRTKLLEGNLSAHTLPLPSSEVAKYVALKRFWPILTAPELG